MVPPPTRPTPAPPLRLASVDLERIPLVERHISPKIDQAGAEIVDPVPAISQRIVIELPVGQPEVADLAYLAAEPQSLIADILAAMTDGYRQAPGQRRIDGNDVDDAEKGIAAV